MKAPKKVKQKLFTKKKNVKTETKKILDDLKMPNLKKSSQGSPSCVILLRVSQS